MFRVLVDLLGPSVGSAIHVLSLREQATDEQRLRFRDLVALGLRSGVSVIGWRYLSPDSGWTVDLRVERDAPVPDVQEFGVLAIAGSTQDGSTGGTPFLASRHEVGGRFVAAHQFLGHEATVIVSAPSLRS